MGWHQAMLNAKGKVPWLALHSEPCSSGLQEVRGVQEVTGRHSASAAAQALACLSAKLIYSLLIK